ncbi:thioredoxin domain-containing protein [Chitinophaga oryzae]|uniref:Thioredoxin domain-containing protein n=1 Tax=Chitinophaga oryzae TaxID=2725414 RepID=A0ABX6LB07_9BACT|nr:vitamin K epoxide reductase family protein [Chitinophaga oryzae]QJB37147.1 thioredoxin domain-containing protein [Chitinophaga oryzae]
MKQLIFPVSGEVASTKLLLDHLKVKVSLTTLATEMESHPDFPGILSVSDILSKFGVENLLAKFDAEQLPQLPAPFLTQISSHDGIGVYFTVVRKIDERQVTYYDKETRSWKTAATENFQKNYMGLVLLAEAGEHAGEADYQQHINAEKRQLTLQYAKLFILPFISLLAMAAALFLEGWNALLPVGFTLTAVLGAMVGFLLLWYETDQYNPLLQQICTAGKKVNCGAVVHSKASKIAGISWSIIGTSYFTGSLLFMLFSGITSVQSLLVMSGLTVLAAPYTIFSVYYQWKVAKQWCLLCLSVQFILLLQLLIPIAGKWHTLAPLSSITLFTGISFALSYLLPFLVITQLMPAFRASREARQNKMKFNQLKHNQQIFEALLAKQKAVEESTTGLGITLGNPDARIKLVKVCNPYCGPCSKAHAPIEELLHGSDDLQVQIIFTATNKEDDHRSLPVKHFLAVAESGDNRQLKEVLDGWYLSPTKDYRQFSGKYMLPDGAMARQGKKVEAMRSWCDRAGIKATPTFFLSMPSADQTTTALYQLPDIYQIKDLKYILNV